MLLTLWPALDTVTVDAMVIPDSLVIQVGFLQATASARNPGHRGVVHRRYVTVGAAFTVPVVYRATIDTGYDWTFEEEELALLLTVGV